LTGSVLLPMINVVAYSRDLNDDHKDDWYI
jgi:hypothetical protein